MYFFYGSFLANLAGSFQGKVIWCTKDTNEIQVKSFPSGESYHLDGMQLRGTSSSNY